MFIRELQVRNYKCFGPEPKRLDFKVPDNRTVGSGLNILVGENGTGKTTIIESINYVTESQFTIQNRMSVFDFNNDSDDILIQAKTDRQFEYKMPELYRGKVFDCEGISLEIKIRDRKSPGKLLSTPLSISTRVMNTTPHYRNKEGKTGKEIQEFHKLFDPSNLTEDLNIFYFDKYRSRHISKGTFRTTFDRIIDDLNWRFYKSLMAEEETQRELLAGMANEYFSKTIEIAQKGAGSKIAEEVKEFFNKEEYEHIKIDLFNLLWPFSDSFFALRDENTLSQIPISKLGSGIEMIFTLLLLRSISGHSPGSIIYLIDEPEMSLHPQAQKKLAELLLQESKNKQIFVSTHSPYFTDPNLIENIKKFKKEDNEIEIFNLSVNDFGDELKENRNFFFRHRDLFFANSAIFVEGVEDFDRYTKFCHKNNFIEIPRFFFMMNGCDPTLFFERFCNQLGIKFCAIVDKDFSIKRSKWARSNRQRFVSDIKEFMQSKEISFDEKKFEEEFLKEIREEPRTDERSIEEIYINDIVINKVVDKNIYVLRKGEVSDYLDKNGEVLTGDDQEEKYKELVSIYSQIKNIIL